MLAYRNPSNEDSDSIFNYTLKLDAYDKKNILITSFEIVNKYCSQFSNLEFDTLEASCIL